MVEIQRVPLWEVIAVTFGNFSKNRIFLLWDHAPMTLPRTNSFMCFISNCFILNVVYLAERDLCPCGCLIRVGRVQAWRKVCGTNVSILFLSCVHRGGEKGKGLIFAVKLHQHTEMSELSFSRYGNDSKYRDH